MKYLLSFFLFLYFANILGQTNSSVIRFIENPKLAHSSIGICIKDLNGKELMSFNKQASLTPASVLKIVTTATALELLGDSFKYDTELFVNNEELQELIINGHGDPTLGSEYIDETSSHFLDVWIDALSRKLKRDIPIDIKINDSYFGYKGISSKWLYEDMGNYYAAGAYGVSLFDNTYRLQFNTMKADTSPTLIKTIPVMKDLDFTNNLHLNNTGQDNGYVRGFPFSNERTLVGDIPAKKTSFVIKGDIPDPGLLLGQSIAERLIAKGYKIQGISTTRSLYFDQMYQKNLKSNIPTSTPAYIHYSPTLKDIVKIVNVKSNNHYSEHLIRTIGRTTNQDIYTDPLDEGINAVKTYWKSKGIETDGLHMYDGCGLAPSNRVTPEMICDILVYMYNKSPYADTFFNSLPKAGREGTVRNLLKGTRLEGHVFVKSGSIANTQCFAGYYINGNQKYAFTIMVNNFNGKHREIVKLIEGFLLNTF